jgi:hypothetical protein
VGRLGHIKLYQQASIYKWRYTGQLNYQWSSGSKIVFRTTSYHDNQQTASSTINKARNAFA